MIARGDHNKTRRSAFSGACAYSLAALFFALAQHSPALASQAVTPTDPSAEISFPEIASPLADALILASDSNAQSQAPAYLEGAGPGWLRAYATGPMPAGERMLLADYYESDIEMAVRKELTAALAEKGVETSADDDSALFQITYSAKLTAGGKKRPRQSSLRLEPDRGGDDPSTFGRQIPETGFRPAIAIGGGSVSKPKAPVLSVSIFVVGGGARVWSGFAETELAGRSPRELASVLTGVLMSHWGEEISLDDLRFVEAADQGGIE